jgi:TonB family protein
MRLPLLLSLLTLPGVAAANPVQAWADGRCPPSSPTKANPVQRFLCLSEAATEELDPFMSRKRLDDSARERAPDPTRSLLRAYVSNWEHGLCELRTEFARFDAARNTFRFPPSAQAHMEQFECRSWVYSWAGHFADALRRGDEAALKANLAALESRAKPGPEPTPRLLAAAKVLAERGNPQQSPDETLYSRTKWRGAVIQLTQAWRLPRQLAALRCRAQEQRGIAVPERCEERVRRALEADLAPVTQVLTEAASRVPAEELRAAEEALAQEHARAQEKAKKEQPLGGAAPLDGVKPFGPGMATPERISGEPLQLSPEALAVRIQGTIIVRFTILPTGEVTRIRIVKPLPHMEETVLKTVATWRYKPVLHEGKPVAVEYTHQEELRAPRKP